MFSDCDCTRVPVGVCRAAHTPSSHTLRGEEGGGRDLAKPGCPSGKPSGVTGRGTCVPGSLLALSLATLPALWADVPQTGIFSLQRQL